MERLARLAQLEKGSRTNVEAEEERLADGIRAQFHGSGAGEARPNAAHLLGHREAWDRYTLENEWSFCLRHMLFALCSIKYRDIEIQEDLARAKIQPNWLRLRSLEIQNNERLGRLDTYEMEERLWKDIHSAFRLDTHRFHFLFSVSCLSVQESSLRKVAVEVEKKARREEVNYILAILNSLQHRSSEALLKAESIERVSLTELEFSERVALYMNIHGIYHNFVSLVEVIEFSKVRMQQRFEWIEVKQRGGVFQDNAAELSALYEQFDEKRAVISRRDAVRSGEISDRSFLQGREHWARMLIVSDFLVGREFHRRLILERLVAGLYASLWNLHTFAITRILLSKEETRGRAVTTSAEKWEFECIRIARSEQRLRNGNAVTFMSTLSLLGHNFRCILTSINESSGRVKVRNEEREVRNLLETKSCRKEEILKRSHIVKKQDEVYAVIHNKAAGWLEKYKTAVQRRIVSMNISYLTQHELDCRTEVVKEQTERRRDLATTMKNEAAELVKGVAKRSLASVLNDANAKAAQGIIVYEVTRREKLSLLQKEGAEFLLRNMKLESLRIKVRNLTAAEEAEEFTSIKRQVDIEWLKESAIQEKKSLFSAAKSQFSWFEKEFQSQDGRIGLLQMETATRVTLQRTGLSTLIDLYRIEVIKRERLNRELREFWVAREFASIRDTFDRYKEYILRELDDVRRTAAKEMIDNRRHIVYNELVIDNIEYFRELRVGFESEVEVRRNALLGHEELEWKGLVIQELLNLEYVQRRMKEVSQLFFRKQIVLHNALIFQKIATCVGVSKAYQQFYGLMRLSFQEYTERGRTMRAECYYHGILRFLRAEFSGRMVVAEGFQKSLLSLSASEIRDRFIRKAIDLNSDEQDRRKTIVVNQSRSMSRFQSILPLWKGKVESMMLTVSEFRTCQESLVLYHIGALHAHAFRVTSARELDARRSLRAAAGAQFAAAVLAGSCRTLAGEECLARTALEHAQTDARSSIAHGQAQEVSLISQQEQRIRTKLKMVSASQRGCLAEEQGARNTLAAAEAEGMSRIILERKVDEVKMQLKVKNSMERPMSAPVDSRTSTRRMKRLTHSAFTSPIRRDVDATVAAPPSQLDDPPTFLQQPLIAFDSGVAGGASRVRSRIGLRSPTNVPRANIAVLSERDLVGLSTRDIYIYYCYKYGVKVVDSVMEALTSVKGKYDYTSIIVGGRGDGIEWTNDPRDVEDAASQADSVGHSFSADLLSPILSRSDRRGVSPDSSIFSYKSQTYPVRPNADQTLPAIPRDPPASATHGTLSNTLHLPHEACTGNSLLPLLEVARVCYRLRVLALQGCAISNGSIEWICEAFVHHRQLQVLDISFNSITALGGLVLEYFAYHCNPIRVIDSTATLISAEQQRNITALIESKFQNRI